MKIGLFITGTDTGCGKTVLTLALMKLLQQQGYKVLGMKPVATGGECAADGACRNEDALRIQQAGSSLVPYELINPYVFAPPIAPHIAAAQMEQEIHPEIIRNNFKALTKLADIVIVEGIGGWLVPLAAHFYVADLPKLLDIPVLLVVGLRLGCINHGLLTAYNIMGRGCNLLGWFANQTHPNVMPQQTAVVASLIDRITAPCLGQMIYCAPHNNLNTPNPIHMLTMLEQSSIIQALDIAVT